MPTVVDGVTGREASFPAKEWSEAIWFRILLVSALALGVFFRLAGLGNKMYSHDEAFSSMEAAGYSAREVYPTLWNGNDETAEDIRKFLKPGEGRGIAETYSILRTEEPHEGPIFFLLANYWMRTIGDSPAAMRGLSALFSLIAIPILYWLGKELFSTDTALLAMAFFALSPYQILFAQDARPYSILSLATILSSAALLYALRKNNWKAWLFYSLTLVIGIYSQLLFALVAIVHALYFAGKDTLLSPKVLGRFFSAAVLGFFAFAPWLRLVILNWDEVAERMAWVNVQLPWYRYIQRWMLNFSSPLLDFDFGSSSLNLIPYFLRALLLLLVAFAWVFLLKNGSFRQKKFLLLLFLIPGGFIILPDVLLGGIRSIGGRYFVPASIVTILVMAYFLSGKLSKTQSLRWKILTGVLFIASIASNTNSLYARTWWNKELSRVSPQFIDVINQDPAVLIVSGYSPTNLGDMLLLSLQVNPDVHFRLYNKLEDFQVLESHQNVYWMPSSVDEVQQASAVKGLQMNEVIPSILWKIKATEN